MRIRAARADELPWVNGVYRRIDFVASDADDVVLIAEVDDAAPHDDVAAAKVGSERAGTGADPRVGVGRLVPVEGGAYELGGMHVDEAHRGRGVAQAIVAALIARAGDAPLWCVPWARVAALYRRFGFVDAPADVTPPPAVAAKLAFCRATYPLAVVLLYRAP